MSASAIRRTIVLAVAVFGLVAGLAFAATTKYRGAVEDDPQTKVTLKLERTRGEEAVVGFRVKQLLIACEGDVAARLGSAALDGEASVSGRGRFKLKGEDPEVKLAIKGTLVDKGAAEGTVVYSGPTVVGGQELECESGKLRWSAAR